MKELIEKSGLKIKEFAEKYEIPYNTVRQWYNGERKTPNWIKKLLEKIANKQIINEEEKADCIIYEYYNENGLKYRAFLPKEKTEEQIDWFNKLQSKFIHKEEGLNKRKIYKAYLWKEGE